MPGPIVHITSGLGATLPLVWLSDGRFTPGHALVHAVNSFVGPDIGVISYLILTAAGQAGLAGWALALIHDPLLFPAVLGAPLAWLWSYLSRRVSRLLPAAGPAVTVRQAYLLLAAGSLTHFSIDNIFEEDGAGHTLFLRWAISTGAFKPSVAPDAVGVLVMGAILFFLLGSYVFVHFSAPPQPAGSVSAFGAVVGRLRIVLVRFWFSAAASFISVIVASAGVYSKMERGCRL